MDKTRSEEFKAVEKQIKEIERDLKQCVKIYDQESKRLEKMIKTGEDPKETIKMLASMREIQKNITLLSEKSEPLFERRAKLMALRYLEDLIRAIEKKFDL